MRGAANAVSGKTQPGESRRMQGRGFKIELNGGEAGNDTVR